MKVGSKDQEHCLLDEGSGIAGLGSGEQLVSVCLATITQWSPRSNSGYLPLPESIRFHPLKTPKIERKKSWGSTLN